MVKCGAGWCADLWGVLSFNSKIGGGQGGVRTCGEL